MKSLPNNGRKSEGAETRRPRGHHSAKFKAKVTLAALRGAKTMAESSQQFDVHATEMTEWRNQLVQQSEHVFMTRTERQAQQIGPSIQELQAKIGELTMENVFLSALGKLDIRSARR